MQPSFLLYDSPQETAQRSDLQKMDLGQKRGEEAGVRGYSGERVFLG